MDWEYSMVYVIETGGTSKELWCSMTPEDLSKVIEHTGECDIQDWVQNSIHKVQFKPRIPSGATPGEL